MASGGIPLNFFASAAKDALTPVLERNSGFEKNKSKPAIDANEMNNNQKRKFARGEPAIFIKKPDRLKRSRPRGHLDIRSANPRLHDGA